MKQSDEKKEEEIHEENKTDDQAVKQSINELQDNLAEELKTDQRSNITSTPYKVAIIGMNELGAATAFLLICRQIVTDVIIIDRNTERLAGKKLKKENLFFISFSFIAEYADLSTCTTFVSGVNIQASNQLTACEGARVVILCDVNDDDDDDEERNREFIDTQSSFSNKKISANLKAISRVVSVYGL